MVKYIFLEGLPGVGKTTIIDEINSYNLKNVHTVSEIINEKYINKQDFYLKNDIKKYNIYKNGIVIIDRGFISTLSYNECKKGNEEKDKVLNFFINNCLVIYQQENVYTYYLKNSKYHIKEKNVLDPYGSIKNQKELEKCTIKNIKKYCKNYKIIDYSYKNMKEFINEIIN